MLSQAITDFLPRLQEQVKQNYLAWGKNSEFSQNNIPEMSYEEGKKYVRIVSGKHGQKSAFGFIDKETGNLLKAAGWKAPAKNFARGNIADADISYINWTSIS